ncbi:hypothetical protein LI90_3190 [Carbonactinospora thermoautotrophica]|uniref:glutamate--cysteine ligase n=1 Tax=Carbonactinospora thermoautotrophica TaxID=1469144 RepID=A0A132MW59_9ACTN|nr:glutamate-cysteine ligase family protein [Carbonactinospora thermoautotrophica]KWX02148.1 hypothetical protein LI90_3190 [Carbonactinospora thermoautotrophica]
MSIPLREPDAEAHVARVCFETRPPRFVAVKLGWRVHDPRRAGRAPEPHQVSAALAPSDHWPVHGHLANQPDGILTISSQPFFRLDDCIRHTAADLALLRRKFAAAGLSLIDGTHPPSVQPTASRRGAVPRQAAGEHRASPHSEAAVQVFLDAGTGDDGPASLRHRWQVAHAIGPVLVAAFANSPMNRGRPSGWRSTRFALLHRLDRQPIPVSDAEEDPRAAWARRVLDATVRLPGMPGLTFRDWIRHRTPRPPTLADLDRHLATVTAPIRPRGHLEIGLADAQPDDCWVVPLAVTTALLEDAAASDAALAATERLSRDRPWTRAARFGLTDPELAAAALECFAAAEAALSRMGVTASVHEAVTDFIEHYVARRRCPADELLTPAPVAACSGCRGS